MSAVIQGSNGNNNDDIQYKRSADDGTGDAQRKRKRRSRWASEESKSILPGMPTVIPTNATEDQKKQYLLQYRIEEVTKMLRTGDLGIPENPEDRSPSPEPLYSNDGKRLNTREFRVRKKLEEERHSAIQELSALNSNYKPPVDYRPPAIKVQDKVMIPQDDYPTINFIGLLIGPRGNTLKRIEKESNSKIMIRGKGSTKEGKAQLYPNSGEDEALHALITGSTADGVKIAVNKIHEIIQCGIDSPEGQNDLKRMQLRELAQLNGTLREEDLNRCRNCGATGHRYWECPEQRNLTSTIACTICGGIGHVATDCKQKSNEEGGNEPVEPVIDREKMDNEYLSLMAELGEGSAPEEITKKPDTTSAATSTPATNLNTVITTATIATTTSTTAVPAPPAPAPAPAPTSVPISGGPHPMPPASGMPMTNMPMAPGPPGFGAFPPYGYPMMPQPTWGGYQPWGYPPMQQPLPHGPSVPSGNPPPPGLAASDTNPSAVPSAPWQQANVPNPGGAPWLQPGAAAPGFDSKNVTAPPPPGTAPWQQAPPPPPPPPPEP